MSTARKNYGNFKPEKGQYVHMWGRGVQLFRVVSAEYHNDIPREHRYNIPLVNLRDIENRRAYTSLSDLKLLTNQIKAKQEYDDAAKRIKAMRKQERDTTKKQKETAKVEVAELTAFLNSNPATHLDGELWDRLRNLSPLAHHTFWKR